MIFGTFLAAIIEGVEMTAISLWDNQQHAEAYAQQSYTEVQQILSKVTDSTPVVRNRGTEASIAKFEKKATKGGRASG